ncbi:MAG: hypothetical protein ABIS01_01275 [Ferruginibacter sp.]
MKSKYVIEKKSDYLSITISGEYEKADFLYYPKIVADACEQHGVFKVLINGLNIAGTDIPTMDRFFIGEDIAKTLGSKIKLAVVWPDEHINKFIETVAVNRGSFMIVVGKVSEAETWLM